MTLIIILLVLAIVFGFTGALVDGLFLLLIIALVLFLFTGYLGFGRRRRGRNRL